MDRRVIPLLPEVLYQSIALVVVEYIDTVFNQGKQGGGILDPVTALLLSSRQLRAVTRKVIRHAVRLQTFDSSGEGGR